MTAVEAGSGYGKSLFAAELLADEPGACVVGGRDVESAWDKVHAALTGGHTVVVDEVEDLPQMIAERLVAAHSVSDSSRLVLLGRDVPDRLVFAAIDSQVLGAEAMAFTDDEVARLLATAGLALGPAAVDTLVAGTARWPAAFVTAITELRRSPAGGPEDRMAATAARLAVARLVERLLGPFDPRERDAIEALAALPFIDTELAGRLGRPGLLEAMARRGLPLLRPMPGWRRVAAPVAARVGIASRLAPELAASVADHYAALGEVSAAIDVLLLAGAPDRAASMLSSLSARQIELLDYADLRAIVDSLPQAVIARHAGVLIHLARVAEQAVDLAGRAEALARAAPLVDFDAGLEAQVEAEVVRDLARDGLADDAARRGAALLERGCGDDARARVRVLEGLAGAAAWRGDPASIARAEAWLLEAAHLAERIRELGWKARVLQALAYQVHLRQARFEAAVRCLDEAITLVADVSQRRGRFLCYRADVHVIVGRRHPAEADLDAAQHVADQYGDEWLRGNIAWERARLAMQAGDAGSAVRWLDEVERHPGEWLAHPGGIEFLADAADILDRVGERVRARNVLSRAIERADAHPDLREIPLLAHAAIEARTGDAALAGTLLERCWTSPEVPMREHWRVSLLSAFAALRRGDLPGAGKLAADAFDRAATLGHPELPFVHERAAAGRLVALAAEAGSLTAASLADVGAPLWVKLLGRFSVRRGGASVELPAGRPTRLLQLIACAGGRLGVEEAIEELWPEERPDLGRQRLRNVLARLRGAAGEIVRRDGEWLVLAPSAAIDAWTFEGLARRALAEPSGSRRAAAAVALAHYAGDLLVEEPYEPWAASARERLRRLWLALLDALAEEARTTGAVEEARGFLQRALDADPLDEDRHVLLARLLIESDQAAAARAVLDRAVAMLAELDLPPSTALARLLDGQRR